MYFDVSDAEIKDFSTELKDCVCESQLRVLIQKAGLLHEEEEILIRHYGTKRDTIENICVDLCISKSTYKRYRRSSIVKLLNYLRLQTLIKRGNNDEK